MKQTLFLLLMLFSIAVGNSFATTEKASAGSHSEAGYTERYYGMFYTTEYDEHPFALKLTSNGHKLSGTIKDERINRTYKVSGTAYEDFSIMLKVINSKGVTIAVIYAYCEDPTDDYSEWNGTYQEKTGKKKTYSLQMFME